ncbi:MAG: FAD-linked oxidase C-terminal domain-containing protein [Armatimonadaceae bacterium]
MEQGFIQALEKIVGADGLRVSNAQKHVYACDAYTLEKALPGVVVLPRTTEEVAAVVKLCHKNKVPIVPRGAGTGLAGGSLAHENEVLISLSRMNKILNIDLKNRQMRAQAGVVNTYLTKAVAGDGFLYAPDPSSQGVCTLGGNIANNSGGPHTLKYGVTVNHILAVQAVLPDGEIIESSLDDHGYDLVGVLVGSEGTLGIVTEATVRLVPAPPAVRTLLAICATVDDATNLVSGIIAAGILPAALEMIDRTILQAVEEAYHLGIPTEAGAVLIIELDGPEAGIDRQAERIEKICMEGGVLQVSRAKTAEERARLWMARKKAIGTIGHLAPSCATQDGVAPRTKLPAILQEIAEIGKKHNLRIANVFHAGDGNLHPAVLFDERDPEEVQRVLAAGADVLRACVAAGGSLTGEHGIGIEKQEFLSLVFSDDDLDTMVKLRSVFNPEGLLNPGKMFPAGGNCCPHLPRPDEATLKALTQTRAAAV